MSEQCEGSSSLTPVPLPLSIPSVCENVGVKEEYNVHSSDDDSETFCTPPTSLTSTDEVSCQIIIV